MNLKVKCLCMTDEDNFVCSIEPKDGMYHWVLESKGKTYGGHTKTQKEAMSEAFKILNPETVMSSFAKVEESAKKLQELLDQPKGLFGLMGLL